LALRRDKVSAYRTSRPAFAEWLVVTSVNLLVRMSIQSSQAAVIYRREHGWRGTHGVDIGMSSWQKSDWRQFYEIARRPWRRHRPPRPVYPSGLNRVAPAQGFSLSELDDAGVDLDLAETLGLPVDAGRIGVYGPNVSVLRDFIRSSRPL